jgi:hypothetical protein
MQRKKKSKNKIRKKRRACGFAGVGMAARIAALPGEKLLGLCTGGLNPPPP